MTDLEIAACKELIRAELSLQEAKVREKQLLERCESVNTLGQSVRAVKAQNEQLRGELAEQTERADRWRDRHDELERELIALDKDLKAERRKLRKLEKDFAQFLKSEARK